MLEGLFVTRVEWNQLMKKIDSLEEYIRNSMRKGTQLKWMKPADAMELMGCKARKLFEQRMAGETD